MDPLNPSVPQPQSAAQQSTSSPAHAQPQSPPPSVPPEPEQPLSEAAASLVAAIADAKLQGLAGAPGAHADEVHPDRRLDDDGEAVHKPSAKELAFQKKLKQSPRPHFIPREFMYGDLPCELKEAVLDIVAPTYQELVLGAGTALERQAGMSLSFILFLELLDQFEIAKQLADRLGVGLPVFSEDREKHIARCLKLVACKQHVANFLLRIQTLKCSSPAGFAALGPRNANFGKS